MRVVCLAYIFQVCFRLGACLERGKLGLKTKGMGRHAAEREAWFRGESHS